MELKDLQEFIKDEKNAGSFKEMVKALGFETPDEIKGLQKTNFELKAEKKKLQEDYVSLKKSVDEIDMDDYTEYKKSKSSGAGAKGDEINKFQRDLKKLTEQLNGEIQKNQKIETEYNESLKRQEISDALGIFNLKDHDLLRSAFLGKARIEVDNGKRSVVIDNGDSLGLSPKEYFQKYSETETGKSYLRQPENRGAGSQSFNGGGGSKTMSRTNFENMSPADRMSAVKSGITITD